MMVLDFIWVDKINLINGIHHILSRLLGLYMKYIIFQYLEKIFVLIFNC